MITALVIRLDCCQPLYFQRMRKKNQVKRMRRCWVCCLRRPFYKQKTAKSKRRRKSRRYSRVPLKMYLLSLKAKVVITLTVTHNCVEKNVCFSTCFRVLHPNVLRCVENKLVFRFSNRQKHAILCWQNDGRNPSSSISTMWSYVTLLSGETMRTVTFTTIRRSLAVT